MTGELPLDQRNRFRDALAIRQGVGGELVATMCTDIGDLFAGDPILLVAALPQAPARGMGPRVPGSRQVRITRTPTMTNF